MITRPECGTPVRNRIACPDGTQFVVYPDGTWEQYTWDGSFVRDHSGASTTPDDVLANVPASPGGLFTSD